jgi:hypothetical protein
MTTTVSFRNVFSKFRAKVSYKLRWICRLLLAVVYYNLREATLKVKYVSTGIIKHYEMTLPAIYSTLLSFKEERILITVSMQV